MAKQDAQLLKVLTRIPILAGLSPSQLQTLVGVCSTRTLARDEWLFQRDDPADAMYVVLKGAVALIRDDGLHLARFEPIMPMGELGLVSSSPRRLGARAEGETTILVVPRKAVDLIIGDDPRMAAAVYRNLILLLAERIDEDNVRAIEYEEVSSRLQRAEQELRATQEALEELGAADRVRASVEARLRESLSTVLVVDDEKEVCNFLARALSEYHVVEADNGVTALERTRERAPDLVIADVNMPQMDGLQLLQELKKEHADLPVIGLSGYVREEAAGNLGFDDFLFKPIRIAKLRSTVKEHLGRGA